MNIGMNIIVYCDAFAITISLGTIISATSKIFSIHHCCSVYYCYLVWCMLHRTLFQGRPHILYNCFEHEKYEVLTHWRRVTHTCVSTLTITGLDYCLTPGRRQVIVWTNAGTVLILPLGNINGMLIEMQPFCWRKCTWKYRIRNGVSFSWRQYVNWDAMFDVW